MTDRYLTIYLRDHLAMARGGMELVERVASANADNPMGPKLDTIMEELDEESDVLKRVMELLDVQPSQLKQATTWLAEKAGRLPLNGQLMGYSPLSRVLELEGLMAAVQARKGLWMTLKDARDVYPEINKIDEQDMTRFAQRADDHLARLEQMHQQAVLTMLKIGQERDAHRRSGSPRP